MKIAEIMTTEPISIEARAPLGLALDTMKELKIRHLPVMVETSEAPLHE